MYEVLLAVQRQISSNGAGNGLFDGIRTAGDLPECCDCSRAFQYCRNNRSRSDEFEQRREEGLAFVLGVVSTGQFQRNGLELQRCDAQSLLLDSAEDLSYVSAGYSVWLDKYKGALSHDYRQ